MNHKTNKTNNNKTKNIVVDENDENSSTDVAIVKLEKIVKQKDDIIIELEKTKANLEEEMKTMNLQIDKLNVSGF